MSNRGALAGVSVVLCAGGSSVSGVNGGEFVVGEGRARNMFPCVQSMDIRLRSMGKSRFEGSIIGHKREPLFVQVHPLPHLLRSSTLFPPAKFDLGISLCLLVNGLTVNSNPLPSGSDGTPSRRDTVVLNIIQKPLTLSLLSMLLLVSPASTTSPLGRTTRS